MKTIRHTSRSRDPLLHIETDFGVVNVRVGLHDATGNAVTSVEIIADRVDWEDQGRTIRLDGAINNRLIAEPTPTDEQRAGPTEQEQVSPLATISFQPEAFDSAAAFFSQIARDRRVGGQDWGGIVANGLQGYCVTVVTRAGERFEAEVIEVTVGEDDGQYKLVLAPWDDDASGGDMSKVRTLDIYDDIERVEVV